MLAKNFDLVHQTVLPRERVGSGDETMGLVTQLFLISCKIINSYKCHSAISLVALKIGSLPKGPGLCHQTFPYANEHTCIIFPVREQNYHPSDNKTLPLCGVRN